MFSFGNLEVKSAVCFFLKAKKILSISLLIIFLSGLSGNLENVAFAATTGKLSGKITDSQTGEPVIAANVIIEGTYMGAAATADGYYYINNIPPGDYTVIVSSIGYEKVTIKKVHIKTDLTFKLDVKLESRTINSKEVVITASKPLVQKDLTSSSVTVSADDIKLMPVESVGQIVNLQAGVVGGHFRGGRSDEVSYLVDGLPVVDSYNGSLPMQIENSSIREIEVISGTFNAEFGQAMSGIVNIVTQDGAQDFHGTLSAYSGDYVTTHTGLFPNVGKLFTFRTKDYQFSLSGPTKILNDLTFFTTGRYFNDPGYLYGQRIFKVTDNPLNGPKDLNNNLILSNSGDSAYVPMSPTERYSFNGKLTYSLSSVKLSYSAFWDKDWNKYFSQQWAWNPDGMMNYYSTSMIHNFQITHIPSQSIYQTLKFLVNRNDYHGGVYGDAFDQRYEDPSQGVPSSSYTFQYGGQQTGRYERQTIESILQWQLNAQVSREHKIGIGAEADWYKLYNHDYSMQSPNSGASTDTTVYAPFYARLGSPGNQAYTKYPTSFAAYIQDKAEYDIMIINFGLRFDYFKPNSQYLYDLTNPEIGTDGQRDHNFPNAGRMVEAKVKTQISPRLGISFPITDKGIIHFSYGHFFQIPSLSNLYVNSDEIIMPNGNLATVMGNPDLQPERTVKYELGLQQALAADLSVDFTVYYQDIRNLLGMEIINTVHSNKYARFINRDYGNVRGFILTLDKRLSDFFSIKVDYTYQLAEGDASDPMAVFYNNQGDPPVQSNKTFVPLNWDQRSTLNISANIGFENDWNIGIVFNYGSGFPYTEDVRITQGLMFENSGQKPPTYNVDLRAQKSFKLYGCELNLYALIYNLLDIKNEYNVNSATGRANDLLIRDINSAGQIIGLNTLQQYINDPTSYSAPRQIRLGVGIGF
jgi:outer membrane receptor protein involved in Fe transport